MLILVQKMNDQALSNQTFVQVNEMIKLERRHDSGNKNRADR